MNNYKRPVITWGNSFYINISLEKFNEGDYEDFDLTKATDLKVYLICATHNTEIPLEYEILQGFNNVLRCFVDYRLLHTTSYGIVVEGYDEQDMHFRFSMLPKEGFLVVNNTSGMSITDDVQVLDISGRVGWGIKVDADLTNYYTKSEVDNLIAEIEVEIGDTYTKEEITQLLTLYPTKEEVNTKFNDYYTKSQTDNLLDAKADKSTLNSDYYNKNSVDNLLDAKADATDLNNYYDKTETDTLLNQKADTSDLNSYQELLVSGQNIKTINNESIIGSGNIEIQGGGGGEQVQADWDETDSTDPAYIQNKPDLDDMQVVIGNALLDNDAKIANVQYNVIPEVRQSLNQRIDETNTALQNTQSSVNDQFDALDDQLYTAAQALNDLKESMPEGGVTSFNGATGAITYEAPVTSVNGMTGAVTIQTGGGGVESFNGMTGAVTYEAPVSSVNGQTGAITISIPTNTSDLTNDSGFLTSAPVSSVNGQTGAVTIDTGVTSFNGATGAVTYEAPVTSVNGMTGAVTIQTGGDPIYYVYIDWQSTPQDSSWQGNQAIQFKTLEVWDLASNTRVYYKSFASYDPSVIFNEIYTQFGIRCTTYLDNMSLDISNLTFRLWNNYRWLDIPQTINNTTYGNGSILSFSFYVWDSSAFKAIGRCNKVVIPFMPGLGRMVTSSSSNLKLEVVAALPATPDANTIYIVQ